MAIPNRKYIPELFGRDLWQEIEKNREKMRDQVKKDLGVIQPDPPAVTGASMAIEIGSTSGYIKKVETEKAKDLSNKKPGKREIIF